MQKENLDGSPIRFVDYAANDLRLPKNYTDKELDELFGLTGEIEQGDTQVVVSRSSTSSNALGEQQQDLLANEIGQSRQINLPKAVVDRMKRGEFNKAELKLLRARLITHQTPGSEALWKTPFPDIEDGAELTPGEKKEIDKLAKLVLAYQEHMEMVKGFTEIPNTESILQTLADSIGELKSAYKQTFKDNSELELSKLIETIKDTFSEHLSSQAQENSQYKDSLTSVVDNIVRSMQQQGGEGGLNLQDPRLVIQNLVDSFHSFQNIQQRWVEKCKYQIFPPKLAEGRILKADEERMIIAQKFATTLIWSDSPLAGYIKQINKLMGLEYSDFVDTLPAINGFIQFDATLMASGEKDYSSVVKQAHELMTNGFPLQVAFSSEAPAPLQYRNGEVKTAYFSAGWAADILFGNGLVEREVVQLGKFDSYYLISHDSDGNPINTRIHTAGLTKQDIEAIAKNDTESISGGYKIRGKVHYTEITQDQAKLIIDADPSKVRKARKIIDFKLRVDGIDSPKFMYELPPDIKEKVQNGTIKAELLFKEGYDPNENDRIIAAHLLFSLTPGDFVQNAYGAVYAKELLEKFKNAGIEFDQVITTPDDLFVFGQTEASGMSIITEDIINTIEQLIIDNKDNPDFDLNNLTVEQQEKIGVLKDSDGNQLNKRFRRWNKNNPKDEKAYISDYISRGIWDTIVDLSRKNRYEEQPLNSYEARTKYGEAVAISQGLKLIKNSVFARSFTRFAHYGQRFYYGYEFDSEATKYLNREERLHYYGIRPDPIRQLPKGYMNRLIENVFAKINPIAIAISGGGKSGPAYLDPTQRRNLGNIKGMEIDEKILANQTHTNLDGEQIPASTQTAKDLMMSLMLENSPYRLQRVLIHDLQQQIINALNAEEFDLAEELSNTLAKSYCKQAVDITSPDSPESIKLSSSTSIHMIHNLPENERKIIGANNFVKTAESMGWDVNPDLMYGPVGLSSAIALGDSYSQYNWVDMGKYFTWLNKYTEASIAMQSNIESFGVAFNNSLSRYDMKRIGVPQQTLKGFHADQLAETIGLLLSEGGMEFLDSKFDGWQSSEETQGLYKEITELLDQVVGTASMFADLTSTNIANLIAKAIDIATYNHDLEYLYDDDLRQGEAPSRRLLNTVNLHHKDYKRVAGILRKAHMDVLVGQDTINADDERVKYTPDDNIDESVIHSNAVVVRNDGSPIHQVKVGSYGPQPILKEMYMSRGFPVGLVGLICKAAMDKFIINKSDRAAIYQLLRTMHNPDAENTNFNVPENAEATKNRLKKIFEQAKAKVTGKNQ